MCACRVCESEGQLGEAVAAVANAEFIKDFMEPHFFKAETVEGWGHHRQQQQQQQQQ